MNEPERSADVLAYWFDAVDQHGVCAPQQHKLWFQSRTETDAHIRSCYGDLVEAALAGRLAHWAETPDGLMALVLLLDQFTRNMYRGTAGAFAGDETALALVQDAIARGVDRAMPTIHRAFLYIPFEHSEDLDVQEQGVELFDQLLADCHEKAREEIHGYREYAVAHRDVIAGFGRFPHRNRILGRESTTAEQGHLEQHGGF